MNNKGQSLVMFIVILPLILMIVALVVDTGLSIYEKNNINSIIKLSINEYFEDDLNEEEVIDLIKKNDKTLKDIKVSFDEDKINVIVEKKVNSVFGRIFEIKIYDVRSEYEGYLEDGRQKIRRIG